MISKAQRILVAGAGCQLYQPLITAYDIAVFPQPACTLLSDPEGVRTLQGANYNHDTHGLSMGGRKNG